MAIAWLRDLSMNWASFFANHAAIRTLIAFVHVAALTTGGGAAITSDWRTLSALSLDEAGRRVQLAAIHSAHRVVVVGLVLIAFSGLLLLAADVETYLYSRVFWIKMGLTALLIVNGAVLLMAARRAARDHDAWSALRATVVASLALWFLTTLTGVALPNIG